MESSEASERALNVHPVTPQKMVFADDGEVPNSTLPVLVYDGVLDFKNMNKEEAERGVDALLESNGWYRGWAYFVYPYLHYHSTAHEGLVVFAGHATIQLGGKKGPMVKVKKGDVIVLPAGVGHERIVNSGTDEDRQKEIEECVVFGIYPNGQKWDFIADHPDVENGGLNMHDNGVKAAAIDRIARVPMPAHDPIHGGTIF